jgi:hypothetical protein
MPRTQNTESVGYLWEKTMVAVDCLCGNSSFESRVVDAYISALGRLQLEDAPPELSEDLRWVLDFCHAQINNGQITRPISESDRRKLTEKLIHILIESSRMTA